MKLILKKILKISKGFTSSGFWIKVKINYSKRGYVYDADLPKIKLDLN